MSRATGDRQTAAALAQALYATMRARLALLERAVAQGEGAALLSLVPGPLSLAKDHGPWTQDSRLKGASMICRWCRKPVETVEVTHSPGVFIVQDCIRPACVQARREELGRRRYAHDLSKRRPHGAAVACLPGMHEPYGYTPPGQPPRCRHCATILPMEETP